MATSLARGIYRKNADGTTDKTSGDIVSLFEGGPVAFANFFRSEAIDHPQTSNYGATIGRTYVSQVECLPITSSGCVPTRFTADVGRPPANVGDRNNAVIAYPELILTGTKFGVPQESRESQQFQFSTSTTGIKYTNLVRTSQVTCFPAFTSSLPNIESFTVDIDEFGIDNGPERDILIESWFHDTKHKDTPTTDNIYGTLNNVIGNISEAGPVVFEDGFQRYTHNNVLLEQMVHIAPIGANNPLHTDAANGTQRPASHYCSTVTIGGWQWEIWYGAGPHSPLIVYNRIGPAGCTGSACTTDLTNEGEITIPYQQLLEYSISPNGLEARLAACGAQNESRGFWADPNHPRYPFDIMREQNRAAVSGIEIGLEPYYNGADDVPFGFILNRLGLRIDGKELGTCSTSNFSLPGDLCNLPLRFAGSGPAVECRLPINFLPYCALPVVLVGKSFSPAPVDCINCPTFDPSPRFLTTYGSGTQNITIDQYADLQNVDFEVTNLVTQGLPGVVEETANGIEFTPDAVGCDVVTGSIKMSWRYRCDPGADWINCSMSLRTVVTPVVAPLGDETITVNTGDDIFIRAATGNDSDEVIQPIVPPPVGELVWTGEGWLYDYPEGLMGQFNIVVPSHINGDKGVDNQRCVTLCIIGGAPRALSADACRSVLAVKDKTGRYVPVSNATNAALSIDQYLAEEVEDFETGLHCVAEPDALRYSLSLTGCQECGDTPIQVGCDIEFMLIKDSKYVNPPTFYGTARIANKGFDIGSGEKLYTVSLIGHGEFWAIGWPL